MSIFQSERQALNALSAAESGSSLSDLQAWLTVARHTGDAGLIAEGLFELGRMQRAHGQLLDALEATSQSATLAESTGNAALMFRTLLAQATLLDDMGRPDDGIKLVERALALDWQPPPTEEARAKGVAGSLLSRIDRHPQALNYLRQAADVQGLDEDERVHRWMALIWHLSDDLDMPSLAQEEWGRLRAEVPLVTLKGWPRTAYWATALGVWSASGDTAPLLSTGAVLLDEHSRHPHVATGWACSMVLGALARLGSLDEALLWARMASEQAANLRSADRRRWLLAEARIAARQGDNQRARQLRGTAGQVGRLNRRSSDMDSRLVLAQLRGLEVRLALAKSQREAEALRVEIARHTAHLRLNQAMPPSLLSELFSLSGRQHLELDEPDLGMLGFHLVFQPFIDVREHRLAGCEALLRLNHPLRGPLTPAEFIPRLDASGEIDTVGRWVLMEACRQLRVWHRQGLSLSVAVNVTANQLDQGGLASHVQRLLTHFGLPADQLELEITETVACSEAEQVVLELDQLRGMGVRVSVDDFGTGYSNFGRLLDIAPSKVKIDRSLVVRLSSGERAERTVATLIRSAQSMAMEVTAEGIETVEQARLLARLGCDLLQGYLIAKPQSAAGLTDLLSLDRDHWMRHLA